MLVLGFLTTTFYDSESTKDQDSLFDREEGSTESSTNINDDSNELNNNSVSYDILVNRVLRNSSSLKVYSIEAIIFGIFNLTSENDHFKENFQAFMEMTYNSYNIGENISVTVISVREKLAEQETLLWLQLTTSFEIIEDISENYESFDNIFDFFDISEFKRYLKTQQGFETENRYELKHETTEIDDSAEIEITSAARELHFHLITMHNVFISIFRC